MNNNGALHGLKVVEYGEFVSAPYCGKLHGRFGADVIKVEKPGTATAPENTALSRKTFLTRKRADCFSI